MLQRYGDDPNLFERCFGALDFVRNRNPAVPNLTENEGNGHSFPPRYPVSLVVRLSSAHAG